MKFIGFLLLSVFATTVSAAIELQSDSSQGHVSFFALGRPSMIRIRGEASGPEGKLAIQNGKANGEFRLDLKNLNTGISLRDEHMKEKYLEVGKNPNAILKIQEMPLPPNLQKINSTEFKGELTLHGVTKAIQGKFEVEESSGQKKAKAEFSIALDDFGIDIPKYMGISVAKEVTVEVNLALREVGSK